MAVTAVRSIPVIMPFMMTSVSSESLSGPMMVNTEPPIAAISATKSASQ